MTLNSIQNQEVIEKLPALSRNDEAIANLLFSLDCISSGKLARAKTSIRATISLLDTDDADAIHARLISMLGGSKHG